MVMASMRSRAKKIWVLGFDELAAHLKHQGYSAAWADQAANLPSGTVAKLAAIFCNAGISHQLGAFDTYRCLAMLAAITGNIGRPGGGCNFMHNTWPGDLGLPELKVKTPAITHPALPQGPDSFASAILEAKPYALRMVLMQGNPIIASANTTRVKDAYAKLEYFVYTGLFMEEAALWADIILPVTSGLETEGVYMRRDDRGIRWQEAAIARQGQTRTDIELWVDLAQAMGRLDKAQGQAYWRQSIPEPWRDYKTLWDLFVTHTPGAQGMTRADDGLQDAAAMAQHQRRPPRHEHPLPGSRALVRGAHRARSRAQGQALPHPSTGGAPAPKRPLPAALLLHTPRGHGQPPQHPLPPGADP